MKHLAFVFIVCVLFLSACKKSLKEVSEPLNADEPELFPTIGRVTLIDCGSSLPREVARYSNDIDTSAFRKGSGVAYWIPYPDGHGGIKIYNIPFADNTAARPHFMLVATDESETVYKGNEVRIILNSDFQTTGVFNGQIRCKPIDNNLVETYSFSNNKRLTYLLGGRAVVPVQPAPDVVTLPEVIVVGTYHSSSGGFNWGLWLNLLDLTGISWGGGGLGGSGGGGGGGGYSSGYYGTVIGGAGGSQYPPGSGVITPSSPDCPMPVVTPSYSDEMPADFSHPSNPMNVPDLGEVVENHVDIEELPQGTPPGNPRLIAHTANRGNTEDMEYGTNGNTQGIAPPSLLNFTDDMLFSTMSAMFDFFTIFNSYLNSVGDLMIQKFRDNVGGTFENETLNQNVSTSSSLSDFLKRFAKELNTALVRAGGDFSSVGALDLGSMRPRFNGVYNKFHGLQILVNDTEYTEIELGEFYSWPNGKWYADVTITIHDHFGLDKHDAITYQGYDMGFPAWWLLQHTRNYKPYETIIKVKKRIWWNP